MNRRERKLKLDRARHHQRQSAAKERTNTLAVVPPGARPLQRGKSRTRISRVMIGILGRKKKL